MTDTEVTTRTRVLLVEDHPPSREYIRELLVGRGYACESRATAEEALGILASGKFRVLVADLFLPGMSGLDLVAQMRDAGVQVPVIAISAAAEQWDPAQIRAAGIRKLLAKPFRSKDLIDAIEEAIGGAEPKVESFDCRLCGRTNEVPDAGGGRHVCQHCGYVQPRADGQPA